MKTSNHMEKTTVRTTNPKHRTDVKCNNINVNVNGFNGIGVGTLPTTLNGLATDEAQVADEGEIGASSIGSDGGSDGGRPSGSDTDSEICMHKKTTTMLLKRQQ